MVGRQPSPLDVGPGAANSRAGLAERPRVARRRTLERIGDQPAAPGLGPARRGRQRRRARRLAGLQSACRAPGLPHLQRPRANPHAGLDPAVHAVLRHRRTAQAGGAGESGRGAGDHPYPGRRARRPAQAARSRRSTAPAATPAGLAADPAGGAAGLPHRAAPGPGAGLDLAAGGRVAGFQRGYRLPDGAGPATVHARHRVRLHPHHRPGRGGHGPRHPVARPPPAALAASRHRRIPPAPAGTRLAAPAGVAAAAGAAAPVAVGEHRRMGRSGDPRQPSGSGAGDLERSARRQPPRRPVRQPEAHARRAPAGRRPGFPRRPAARPVAPGGTLLRPHFRGTAAGGDLRLGTAAHRLVRPGRTGQADVRRNRRLLPAAAGHPARHRQPAAEPRRGGPGAAPGSLATAAPAGPAGCRPVGVRRPAPGADLRLAGNHRRRVLHALRRRHRQPDDRRPAIVPHGPDRRGMLLVGLTGALLNALGQRIEARATRWRHA